MLARCFRYTESPSPAVTHTLLRYFPDQDVMERERMITVMVMMRTIRIAGMRKKVAFPKQETLISVKMVKQAAGMTTPIFLLFIKD
jgi:hypothetical protein